MAVEDWPEVWHLLPVSDDSDRSRIRRTANHVARANRAEWIEQARAAGSLPPDAVAIADNGGGDLLVLTGTRRYAIWDGETGELLDATIVWLFPGDDMPPYVE